MSSMLRFLGAGKAAQVEPIDPMKLSVRALPAAWYTTREMYELERRAIFSKRWLLITHRNRLTMPGDFLRYPVAGFEFIIVSDRDGEVNAFHNVCRHRAYPVVEQESGNAKILACRYHGWSYGLNGKLAKAPNYQTLTSFEKEKNGLLPIHVHVDMQGFIWVNMDTAETPEIPWAEHFSEVDEQPRFDKFDFDKYELDHIYELEADYNWKIAADNFNECYHCKTTHADVPSFLTIDSHDCIGKGGHIQHDLAGTPQMLQDGLSVNSTYYFPNVSMTVSPHFMMIQKFLPSSATKTTCHYEIFRRQGSSDEDFNKISEMYARVMGEDKVLCNLAQRNLNRGVFVNGEMHPRWERGPLYFQQTCRDVVTEHFDKEKALGRKIWPAQQKLPDTADVSAKDMEICNGLGCDSVKEGLAW